MSVYTLHAREFYGDGAEQNLMHALRAAFRNFIGGGGGGGGNIAIPKSRGQVL